MKLKNGIIMNNIEYIRKSFNKSLKKLFAKKSTFFQLLSELIEEESKYYIDYDRRTSGILKKKKKKKKNIEWGNQGFS